MLPHKAKHLHLGRDQIAQILTEVDGQPLAKEQQWAVVHSVGVKGWSVGKVVKNGSGWGFLPRRQDLAEAVAWECAFELARRDGEDWATGLRTRFAQGVLALENVHMETGAVADEAVA